MKGRPSTMYTVKGDLFLQHFRVCWDFQNLQRATLETLWAFLAFQKLHFCCLTFLYLFSEVFKVCEHSQFSCRGAHLSVSCHDGVSPAPCPLWPPWQTALCADSLPLRDKGQVSHPTETAQKGEDDSQVQTYPMDSDRNTAQWLRSQHRQMGYSQTKPREGQSQQMGARGSPLTPPPEEDIAVM